MGQDGRGMGEKEDPRMRQQQNPLASPTVRHFIIVSAPSNALALSFSFFLYTLPLTLFPVAFVLCPFRDSARRTAVTYVYIDPTDSSVCLHANASIIARGLLNYSPISFVSRKPSAKCIVLSSFVLYLTNNEDGMKDIIT